jgi:thioredoxin 1
LEVRKMSQSFLNLDTQTFDEVIKGAQKLVLVDFWAEWCGPCKAMEPVLDSVASEIGSDVIIAKVNVDDNPELASRFQVMAIPTFLLFKDGQEIARIRGALPKDQLLSKIQAYI